MAQDYQRLLRIDLKREGALEQFVQELVTMLNTAPATSDDGDGSGNVFVGTIVSGTGTTYQASLDDGLTVEVTVPGILDTETIPAGSVGVVKRIVGDVYQMVFPLWVE